MARPKVHPNNRKRATEACNFCRSSKKRCSATVPCTACLRRGIADTCFLTYQPRRASHNSSARLQPPETQHGSTTIHVGGNSKDNAVGGEEASASTSANLNQNNVEPSQIACIGQGQSSPTLEPPCDHTSTACHASSSGSITSSNAVESHSRMLLNRRGDRGTYAWV